MTRFAEKSMDLERFKVVLGCVAQAHYPRVRTELALDWILQRHALKYSPLYEARRQAHGARRAAAFGKNTGAEAPAAALHEESDRHEAAASLQATWRAKFAWLHARREACVALQSWWRSYAAKRRWADQVRSALFN